MKPVKPGDSITADEWLKIHTLALLNRKNGEKKATAKTLGIDRGTLDEWLKAWGFIKGFFVRPAASQPEPTPAAPRPATELTPEEKLRHDPPTLL